MENNDATVRPFAELRSTIEEKIDNIIFPEFKTKNYESKEA